MFWLQLCYITHTPWCVCVSVCVRECVCMCARASYQSRSDKLGMQGSSRQVIQTACGGYSNNSVVQTGISDHRKLVSLCVKYSFRVEYFLSLVVLSLVSEACATWTVAPLCRWVCLCSISVASASPPLTPFDMFGPLWRWTCVVTERQTERWGRWGEGSGETRPGRHRPGSSDGPYTSSKSPSSRVSCPQTEVLADIWGMLFSGDVALVKVQVTVCRAAAHSADASKCQASGIYQKPWKTRTRLHFRKTFLPNETWTEDLLVSDSVFPSLSQYQEEHFISNAYVQCFALNLSLKCLMRPKQAMFCG